MGARMESAVKGPFCHSHGRVRATSPRGKAESAVATSNRPSCIAKPRPLEYRPRTDPEQCARFGGWPLTPRRPRKPLLQLIDDRLGLLQMVHDTSVASLKIAFKRRAARLWYERIVEQVRQLLVQS